MTRADITKGCVLLCFLALAAGCAPKTRYTWENYDQKLYQHYKNPAKYEEFTAELKEIIEEGEAGGKVPPGLYAEYGYTLYEKGKFDEAVPFFKKESERWPESRVLMAKMINNAELRAKTPPARAVAGGDK